MSKRRKPHKECEVCFNEATLFGFNGSTFQQVCEDHTGHGFVKDVDMWFLSREELELAMLKEAL